MARLFLMGACLLLGTLSGPALAGPFEDDVDAAIADGVRWLRDQQAFTGEALDLAQARGLALLVLVESMPGSYAAADAGDQALAREAAQRILTNPDVGVPRAFYVYFHAVNLLGLAAYVRAGGPEIDGAPFTLRGALEKLTDETLAAQSLDGPTAGFWGYVGPGNDSSATQYAAAALAAARGAFRAMGDAAALARVEAIDQALALTALGYVAHPEPDGGMKYRFDAFYRSSFQQTAASLWCQLLGGLTLADPATQGAMRWLADRYNYATSERYRDFWRVSYAYYLWTSAKAYLLIEEGAGGAAPGDVGPADLGLQPADPVPNATFGDIGRLVRRDPAADAQPAARGLGGPGTYADAAPGWYYDYAYTIMSRQAADGRFDPGGHGQWNRIAAQAYALLVLQRSLGGACPDDDGDGVCNGVDVCPGVADPDQIDADGDGRGAACDCDDADPAVFPGAAEACDFADNDCDATADEGFDADGDGVSTCGGDCDDGDASRAPGFDEVCDGADQDCDDAADEGLVDLACATGEPGACAAGVTVCGPDGWPICARTTEPAPEACDGVDDDCDGAVDEGLRNACGACGPAPAEGCDGVDDDCDGLVDEGLGLGDACEGEGGTGTIVCDDAGGTTCHVDVCVPAPELCNGRDDDCDGRVDEDGPTRRFAVEGAGGRYGGLRLRGDHRGARPQAYDIQPGGTLEIDGDLLHLRFDAGDEDDAWSVAVELALPAPAEGRRGDRGRRGDLDFVAGTLTRADAEVAMEAGAGWHLHDLRLEGRFDLPGRGHGHHPDGEVRLALRALPACPVACAGPPAAEICNGLDDDCDGWADEDFRVGEACTEGLGVCAAAGTLVCEGDGVRCDAEPGAPGEEVRNRLDDDCDGAIDEDVRGRPCPRDHGRR